MEDTKRIYPTTQGKVIQQDYDWITSLTGECSYCLTNAQVQMILTTVDYLGWPTRWYSETNQVDKDVISALKSGLVKALMNGCCDDNAIYRWTIDFVLEISIDGGETWTPAPQDDPRQNSPEFPPIAGDDGDDKKCIAATGMTYLIKTQIADQLTDDMGIYDLQELIRDWTGLAINSGGNIFQILITIAANQILALGILIIQAALTEAVYDTLTCIFYCNMEDDASFTTVDGVTSDIGDQIGGVATLFLQQLVNLLGTGGLTNLARSGGATEGDCDDCDCDITCDLDLWEIATHEGNDVGTEIGRGANYIDIQTENVPGFGGALFAMIRTGGASECCTYTGYEVQSGGALSADQFVTCGNPPWPGTAWGGGGLPASVNTVVVWSATTSVVRIFFD